MNALLASKALIIGIADYNDPDAKRGMGSCVNDATQIHRLLEEHQDHSANFDAHLELNQSCKQMRTKVEQLFNPKRAPDHALLYFSGHGYVDSDGGYLVGKDYSTADMGISMDWLMQQIAASGIKQITLIFDCCYAGSFGKIQSENRPLASLPENVTLLAAVKSDDVAQGGRQFGKLTKILIQGLEGAAADALGRVTAAGLYSLADTMLTPWQQRPVFKSFVTAIEPLRNCVPAVDKELLQALNGYDFFKDRERKMQLQPRDVCTDPHKQKGVARFAQLTAFQRAGLIQCANSHTVYEAALRSETYKLTPVGHFFLELLDKKRI